MKYYSQLNGFRFICILLVLFEHWLPYVVYKYTRSGVIGVNLFFVLSGFLLGEILILQKRKETSIGEKIKNFYWRRSLRIFPLYYAVILMVAILMGTGGILWWNLTYTTNFLECINLNAVPLEYSHLWSLCVEEQFYLFFPFLILLVPDHRLINVFLGFIVIALLWRLCVPFIFQDNQYRWSSRFIISAFDSLFGGAALAWAKIYRLEKIKKLFLNKVLFTSVILAIVSFIIWLNISQNEQMSNVLLRLFTTILGVIIIGYSVVIGFKGLAGKILEHPVISYFGKISYGIYLVHPFIQKEYFDMVDQQWLKQKVSIIPKLAYNLYLVNFAVLFLMTITISALSFELFEKRFLKLKSIPFQRIFHQGRLNKKHI